MRQVMSIQNRVHNSGVPAWFCCLNNFGGQSWLLHVPHIPNKSWKDNKKTGDIRTIDKEIKVET
jgi:hypothetical protein